MKTFSITAIIAAFLFICTNGIQAQTKPTSPANTNKFELIKQLHSNLPPEIKQPFDENHYQLPQGFENLQNPEIPKAGKANQLKSATADGQQLDSVITETWDTITSQWVVSGKEKYTHDKNGNLTFNDIFRWNASSSQWIPEIKSETAFDANGKMTLSSRYNWDNSTSQWIGEYKYEYAYDSNGIITLESQYNWDNSTSQWIGEYKYEYAYDSNGKMTLSSHYKWDNSKSQWLYDKKFDYVRDSNGNTISQCNYNWNATSSQWIAYSKSDFAYNANGKMTLYIGYNWNDSTNLWVIISKFENAFDVNGKTTLLIYYKSPYPMGDSKYEFTYDAFGNLTLFCRYNWVETKNQYYATETVEYTYDNKGRISSYIAYNCYNWADWAADAHWIGTNKWERFYDDNGNLTNQIDYSFDRATNQWHISQKYEFSYDKNGKSILEITYNWDYTTSQWIYSSKNEYTYDTNGRRILESTYGWDRSNSQWYYWTKNEYVFDINGKMIEYCRYENLDPTTTKWVCIEKLLYNANGSPTFYYNQNWHQINELDEHVEIKKEYTYDSNGHLILFIPYQWDKNTNQWIEHYLHYSTIGGHSVNNSFIKSSIYGSLKQENPYDPNDGYFLKQEYAYDVYGNMTLNITYNWDETAHRFVYNTRTTWYYSDKSTFSIPNTPNPILSVYPNPSKDFIVFDLPNSSESATVELYDIHGKKVVHKKLSETKQIAVGNLPKGLYLYRLIDGETIYSGKLVVE